MIFIINYIPIILLLTKHEYISSMNPRLLISKFISASGEICNLDKMRKLKKIALGFAQLFRSFWEMIGPILMFFSMLSTFIQPWNLSTGNIQIVNKIQNRPKNLFYLSITKKILFQCLNKKFVLNHPCLFGRWNPPGLIIFLLGERSKETHHQWTFSK